MERYIIMFMLLLCLNIGVKAQKNILDKRVSLSYSEATLEYAIKDIRNRYGVHFSYSSTHIFMNRKVTLNIKDLALGEALDKLFKSSGISYELVGNLVVLKKSNMPIESQENSMGSGPSKHIHQIAIVSIADYNPSEDKEREDEGIEPEEIKTKPTVEPTEELIVNSTPVKDTSQNEVEGDDKAMARKWYLAEKRRLKGEYNQKIDSINRLSKERNALIESLERAIRKVDNEFQELQLNWSRKQGIQTDSLGERFDGLDTSFLYRRAQLSFISPIGTNGENSGRTVNNISFNVFYGRHAGLDGVELGFINQNTHYTRGAQFGYLANINQGETFGVQWSGLININKGLSTAVQFSSLLNYNGAFFSGAQFAGFGNFSEASVEGVQFAGFMNMADDNISAIQAAGFMNIASGSVDGGQMSGFINIAGGRVYGGQISPFLNIAGGLRGAQLGVFNITDSVSENSVQVGLISFPGRNGMYDFELSTSEALFHTLEFKMGTRGFYNIFGTGYQTGIDANERYGIGYGLGTKVQALRKLSINFEIDAYQIKEPKLDWFDELNLLNQGRMKFGIGFTRSVSLVIGPTFNVMVSKLKNEGGMYVGSDFTPSGFLLYNESESDAHIKLWVGGQLGIRISL